MNNTIFLQKLTKELPLRPVCGMTFDIHGQGSLIGTKAQEARQRINRMKILAVFFDIRFWMPPGADTASPIRMLFAKQGSLRPQQISNMSKPRLIIAAPVEFATRLCVHLICAPRLRNRKPSRTIRTDFPVSVKHMATVCQLAVLFVYSAILLLPEDRSPAISRKSADAWRTKIHASTSAARTVWY